jgi:hypothetical protein
MKEHESAEARQHSVEAALLRPQKVSVARNEAAKQHKGEHVGEDRGELVPRTPIGPYIPIKDKGAPTYVREATSDDDKDRSRSSERK